MLYEFPVILVAVATMWGVYELFGVSTFAAAFPFALIGIVAGAEWLAR